jgi:hypothetical protein
MLSISVALYGSGGVDPNQHSLKQMARVCSWKPTQKERDMTNIKMTTAMVFSARLLLGAERTSTLRIGRWPSCKGVSNALQTGNVNPVLAHALVSAETEIRMDFEKSNKVRMLGADACNCRSSFHGNGLQSMPSQRAT